MTTPTEADIRSAVSRSYYAAYHHVLLWWKSNNRFPNYKDRGHAKIQMVFFNAGITDAKEFSKILRILNNHRQEADYELAVKYNIKRGKSILDLAHDAVSAFDAIDKNALVEGIENYLQKTNQI